MLRLAGGANSVYPMACRHAHNPWLALGLIIALGCALIACKRDATTVSPAAAVYKHGAYILCEGNYGWGQGSVEYLDTANPAAQTIDAYLAANGFPAGNVVQSFTVSGDSAYLVVNNSNKVELLDRRTLKRLRANTQLVSPRYALPVGSDLWVTDLFAGRITILDRATLAFKRTIKAPGWTEQLLFLQGKVYVANRRQTSQAAGGRNEQILVCDPVSYSIVDSIKFAGGRGCQDLVAAPQDAGKLYTLLEYDSIHGGPALAAITLADKSVQTWPTAVDGRQPTRLQATLAGLFWLQGDKVCRWPFDGEIRSVQPYGPGANLTALQFVRSTGGPNADLLWVGNAQDYVSRATVSLFKVDWTARSVVMIKNAKTGVIPGKIVLF